MAILMKLQDRQASAKTYNISRNKLWELLSLKDPDILGLNLQSTLQLETIKWSLAEWRGSLQVEVISLLNNSNKINRQLDQEVHLKGHLSQTKRTFHQIAPIFLLFSNEYQRRQVYCETLRIWWKTSNNKKFKSNRNPARMKIQTWLI